jgi:WD40 repeat protein
MTDHKDHKDHAIDSNKIETTTPLDERKTYLSNYCNSHILKDLSDLVSHYDYHIESIPQILENKSVEKMKMLPDGRIACTTNHLYQLSIWNHLTRRCDISVKGIASNFIITKTGKIISGTYEDNLIQLDPETNERKIICKEDNIMMPFMFLYKIVELLNDFIAVSIMDHRILIIDTQHCIVEYILIASDDAKDMVSQVILLPNISSEKYLIGRIAVVTNKCLKIWNLDSKECIFTMKCDSNIFRIKSLPDGRVIISTVCGKIMILCPGKNQSEYILDDILQDEHSIRYIDFRILSNGLLVSYSIPEIRKPLSESDHCSIKIWNLEKKIKVMTLKGHTQLCIDVAELPDGRIVSASMDKTLKIWNLLAIEDTERCEITLTNSSLVTNILVLLDGKIACGTCDTFTEENNKMILNKGALTIWK